VPNKELNHMMSPMKPPLGRVRTPSSSNWSPRPATVSAIAVIASFLSQGVPMAINKYNKK